MGKYMIQLLVLLLKIFEGDCMPIPSDDRRLSAKLAPIISGRGARVVSAMNTRAC
jgi:hypothetical protein